MRNELLYVRVTYMIMLTIIAAKNEKKDMKSLRKHANRGERKYVKRKLARNNLNSTLLRLG